MRTKKNYQRNAESKQQQLELDLAPQRSERQAFADLKKQCSPEYLKPRRTKRAPAYDIPAKPCEHEGVKFDSTLELLWWLFLMAIVGRHGLYRERAGFLLLDGSWCWPDFLVSNGYRFSYLEVKPKRRGVSFEREFEKTLRLQREQRIPMVYLHGDSPTDTDIQLVWHLRGDDSPPAIDWARRQFEEIRLKIDY